MERYQEEFCPDWDLYICTRTGILKMTYSKSCRLFRRWSAVFAQAISITVFAVSDSWAASFDCKKASTPMEKAICSNPELSKADEGLGAAYAELKYHVSPFVFARVRDEQRQWLRIVSKKCAAGTEKNGGDCILTEFRTRVESLQKFRTSRGDDLLRYGVKVMIEDKDDGGYEERTFTFIDSEEPLAAAVNRLINDEMQKALREDNGSSKCEASWTPEKWVSNGFVRITNRQECAGGAHSTIGLTCSVFSIEKRRQLVMADIFTGPEYVDYVNQYAAKHFIQVKRENPSMSDVSYKERLTEQVFMQERFGGESCSGKEGYFVTGFGLSDAERNLDSVTIPWPVLASKMTPFAKTLFLK